MADLIALRLPGQALAPWLKRVWDAGDAALPLDPRMRPQETGRVLTAMRPAAVVTAGGVEGVPDPAPVNDGTALVVLTSGTTGQPKGVELSHAALEASARTSLDRIEATPDDVWLACLPLHHIAGLSILARSRLTGSLVVVQDRFDVDAFQKQRAATLVSLVPTMLARTLDAGVDLTRFKAVLLGGAAPAPALVQRARDAAVNVIVTYGMTETCGGCVYDGRPLDGVELRIGDAGEIMIKGPVLMSGYRLSDENPIEDGWFRTADAGEIDAAGLLNVLGRLDDLIVTGGKNVSPAEVEAALAEHPLVGDVAVAARPDVEWGQRVVAFVVPRAELSPGELRSFARTRLSPHKVPKEFILLDEIPRNPAGKVDRSALP